MSRSEKEPTEIIRPVKIPGKNQRTEKSFIERHRWATVWMLAFALLFTVVGGALFLRYLAQHPLEPTKAVGPELNAELRLRQKTTAREKTAAITKDRSTEALDSARPASEKEEAEQKPADFGKEGPGSIENEDVQEGQRKSLSARMDPADDSAHRDLERAKKIEAVTRLIKSGKGHEKTGNLSFAHTDYQEALRLDAESKEAQEALSRVQGQIKGQEFQQLMSEGMTAFHQNNFPLARDKWLKAKSFRPESQEVGNALAQVDQAIRSAQLEEVREKAVKAAQTMVKLTIESDNLTEVTLYKVGRLGRFSLREFDLRPGTYTVVGARDGYQDVRLKIEIKPGQGPQHITIKCIVQI